MRRLLIRSGDGFCDLLPLRLPDRDFLERFSTEEACRDFLFRARWPRGFVCRTCGPSPFRWLDARRMVCLRCHKKTSLTAGTILHGTRKPLRDWFRAAYLVGQPGTNARVLQTILRLTYKVAWTWSQKLRRLMALQTGVEPRPPERGRSPRGPWFKELANGGFFEWHAVRPGDLGRCCERLDRHDWDEPPFAGRLIDLARSRLFAEHSGSLSDKHLAGYFRETEFRMNHRRLPPSEVALRVIGRFADVEPVPYSTIRGPRPRRRPLVIFGPPARRETVLAFSAPGAS